MEHRISIITLGVLNMPISIRFYRDGLGFQTNAMESDGWAIFKTYGTRLSLFPFHELAKDAGIHPASKPSFSGITLAHNVKSTQEVDECLQMAADHGGKITSPAHNRVWGVYSGYFSDPDGYNWEVAYGEEWEFDSNGQLWGGPLGPPKA